MYERVLHSVLIPFEQRSQTELGVECDAHYTQCCPVISSRSEPYTIFPLFASWGTEWFTVLDAVTALVLLIDEHGEAYLAADGLSVDCQGNPLDQFAVKTARVNSRLAVGIAGSTTVGNALLAYLFKQSALVACGADIDICKLFEAHDVTIDDATYEGAREFIAWQLESWKAGYKEKGEGLPDLNVVLVGQSEDGPRFCFWHCAYGWKLEQSPVWRPGDSHGVPLGPIPDQEAKEALRDLGKKPPNRIRDSIRVFARKRPDAVNRNVMIRRLSNGFTIEPENWLGLNSTEWPEGIERV
jgi:hypothetical protein